VDVGVDERGRDEAALGVELTAAVGFERSRGDDGGDRFAVDDDVDEAGAGGRRRVGARVADDETRGEPS
jgi:hypothetical protein